MNKTYRTSLFWLILAALDVISGFLQGWTTLGKVLLVAFAMFGVLPLIFQAIDHRMLILRFVILGRVVRFYSQRGTAEQWIKEGKNAVKWTPPVLSRLCG